MSDGWATAHAFAVRVYYEDTDFSGVVYHANYLRFLERGRTEFLRDSGIRQSDLHAQGRGTAFAVRHMTIGFHAPARMDDALAVQTRVAAIGGASVTMVQRILRDEAVLVDATVRIGLVATGRAQRLPRDLLACLRAMPDAREETIS